MTKRIKIYQETERKTKRKEQKRKLKKILPSHEKSINTSRQVKKKKSVKKKKKEKYLKIRIKKWPNKGVKKLRKQPVVDLMRKIREEGEG